MKAIEVLFENHEPYVRAISDYCYGIKVNGDFHLRTNIHAIASVLTPTEISLISHLLGPFDGADGHDGPLVSTFKHFGKYEARCDLRTKLGLNGLLSEEGIFVEIAHKYASATVGVSIYDVLLAGLDTHLHSTLFAVQSPGIWQTKREWFCTKRSEYVERNLWGEAVNLGLVKHLDIFGQNYIFSVERRICAKNNLHYKSADQEQFELELK